MPSSKPPLWTKDFISICFVNLLLFFTFQMFFPTLPIFLKDIGGSDIVVGMATSITSLAALIIRPVAGLVSDRYGRKPFIISGIVFSMIILFLHGLFQVVAVILLLRVFHGFSFSIAHTALTTAGSDIIPKKRFGEGMGFFNLSTTLSLALSPAIGLAIMSAFGFTGMTLAVTGMALVALVLSSLIKYRPVEKQHAVKFSFYEKSSLRPSIIMFFFGAAYSPFLVFMSLLAEQKGIDNIGLFFTVAAALMFVSRPFFGRLIDRCGFHVAMLPGFVFQLAGMMTISFSTTLSGVLLSAVFTGIGYGTVATCLQTMAVVNAPKERYGAANATYFMGLDGGFAAGSLIAGEIAGAVGYDRMFLLMSSLLVVGGLLYLLLARKIKKQPLVTDIRESELLVD